MTCRLVRVVNTGAIDASRDDQPAWARPALLLLAALAALAYAWRSGNELEIYYAAAVRSMSASWHDFFFGAFDPAGTITLDKLPGALWVQALSVRLFGLHGWALVLPQVVEGTATVLVVYRAVRRLAGPPAGLIAAGLVAAAPAAATLDRGNIPDTLMILLTALAANAMVSALVTGHLRHVLLSGAYVGLAFQAKMLEAWLVLPALALVFVVAGAPGWWRRWLAVLGMGAVAVAVSLSWMTVVSTVPAAERPYVDGSHDNSLFQQVFVYNGFGRVDEESPDQLLSRTTGLVIGTGKPPPVAWNRLLTGSLGLDTGWLVPDAVVALVSGLLARRRQPRTDLPRAGLLLFGGWLVALFTVFSVTSTINSYYTAALAPPVAGLVAIGLVLAWRQRNSALARLTVGAGVAATSAYALWILPSSGTGLPGWLAPSVAALGAFALVGLLLPERLTSAVPVGLTLFAVVTLSASVAPAVATASIVENRLAAFDTPFQPESVTRYIHQFFVVTPEEATRTLPTIEKVRNGARYLMAVQTSAVAAPFIYRTGLEVLPIGGFTGTIPSPSLARLKTMIQKSDFHLVLQSPTTRDPRLVWVAEHCASAGERRGAGPRASAPLFAIYYCLPSSLTAPARAAP